MKIEDISRTGMAVLPDWMGNPSVAEICREPSENSPPGGAHVEEYLPMPTPPPLWPRVFPGL